jgi:hypothetical protein
MKASAAEKHEEYPKSTARNGCATGTLESESG